MQPLSLFLHSKGFQSLWPRVMTFRGADATGKQIREVQLQLLGASLRVLQWQWLQWKHWKNWHFWGNSYSLHQDRFKVEAMASAGPMACFVKQPGKKESFNNSGFLWISVWEKMTVCNGTASLPFCV